MAGHPLVGAILSVAGDGTVDQARIDRLHGLIAQAQPVHDAGTEAFDERIGAADQFKQLRTVGGIFQVKPHQLLASIDCDEQLRHLMLHMTHRARVIAGAAVFDLDDGRTHVGQMHGRDRARQQPGQVRCKAARQCGGQINRS